MVNVKQLIREKENKDVSEMKTLTPTQTQTQTPQKDVLKREEHFNDVKEVRGQEGYRREDLRRLPLSSEQNRTKTPEVTIREEENRLIRENRVMTEELIHAEKKIRELKDGMKMTEAHVIQMKRAHADIEGERRDEAVRQQVASEQLLYAAEQRNEELKSKMKASGDGMLKMKADLHIKDEWREDGKLWEGTIEQISTEHSDYINKMRTAETKVHRMEHEIGTTVNVVELLREKEALKEQLRTAVQHNQEMRVKINVTESNVERMEEMIRLLKEERREERQRWEEKLQEITEEHINYVNKMRATEAKVMRIEEEMTTLIKERIRMKQAWAQQSPTSEMNKDTKSETRTPEGGVVRKQEAMFKDTREEPSRDMGKTVEERLQRISTEQSRDMNKMQTTVNQVHRIKSMFSQMKEDITEVAEERGLGLEGVKDDEDQRQRLKQIVEEYNKSDMNKMNVAEGKEMTEISTVRQLVKIKEALREQLLIAEQKNADMKNKMKTTEDSVQMMEEQIRDIKEELTKTESKVQRLERMSPIAEGTSQPRIKKRKPRRERSISPEPKRLEMRYDSKKTTTAEYNPPRIQEPLKDIKERNRTPEGSTFQKPEEFTPVVGVKGLIRKTEALAEPLPSPTPKSPEMRTTDYNILRAEGKKEVPIKNVPLKGQSPYPAPKSPEMKTADYNLLRTEGKRDYNVPRTEGKKEEPMKRAGSRAQESESEAETPAINVRQLVRRTEAFREPSPSPEPRIEEIKSEISVRRRTEAFRGPSPSPEPRIDEIKSERSVRKVDEKMRDINKEPTRKNKVEMTPFSINKEPSRKNKEEKTPTFTINKEPSRKGKEEEMTPTFSVRQIIRNKETLVDNLLSEWNEDMEKKVKDIKEPFKTTEGGSKVPKSEEETTRRETQQMRKHETLREPSLEQPPPSEMEETPVSVRQMIRNKEETKTPDKHVKTPKTTENRVQGPEKHVQRIRDVKEGPIKTTENRVPESEVMTPVAKAKQIFRRVEASPEPKNEDMKYDKRTTEKNVSAKDNKGARREGQTQGADKRLQRFTAEHDDHPNKTRVPKAEEETPMAVSVKRLIRQNEIFTEEQDEPREEGRTAKDERPHVIPAEQIPRANKTPYFSMLNKTTDHGDNEATREKEAMAVHMLPAEHKKKAMKNELRALEDNKRREETLQPAPAEGDLRADEITAKMVDMKQLLREKEAMKEQLLTAEQKKKHMRDEMKTMAHNVQKIEEQIKNMEEEQRGESPSRQLTAEHDEDISVQTNTTEHLQVEEKMQDIELENLMLHFTSLTLDPLTASKRLCLSENNRRVTNVPENQSYPYHPDRFDYWSQVMCKEGLTRRCYWEVEWTLQVSIAVAYKGIPRRGHSNFGLLGFNDMSWSLDCFAHNPPGGNKYTVRHNNHKEELAVSPPGSNRVGVYLDWPAGKLSFYCVSADRRTHLYTFECVFKEPLHCAIWCWTVDSSVSLCQREDIQ